MLTQRTPCSPWLGLKDTDGDGILNFPDGGKNVEITLLANADYGSDKSLAEGVVAMDANRLACASSPTCLQATTVMHGRKSGKFDWHVWRARVPGIVDGGPEHVAPCTRPARD